MKIFTVDALPSPYYKPTLMLKWVEKDSLDTHPVLVQQYESSIWGEKDIWVEVPTEKLSEDKP